MTLMCTTQQVYRNSGEGESAEDEKKGKMNTKWLKHTETIRSSIFKWNQVLHKINFDLMEWNCRLLVATTGSQMTIFLVGIQSGKLQTGRIRKKKREEQEYWHVIHFQQLSDRKLQVDSCDGWLMWI